MNKPIIITTFTESKITASLKNKPNNNVAKLVSNENFSKPSSLSFSNGAASICKYNEINKGFPSHKPSKCEGLRFMQKNSS